MTARAFRPYRHLPTDNGPVESSNWTMPDGRILGSSVDWHPVSDITLHRRIHFDLAAAGEILGSAAKHLLLAVEWSSSTVSLRGRLNLQRLNDGENRISVTLSGSDIGGSITLRTTVMTAETIEQPEDAGTPNRPGLVVWEDRMKFRVEGNGDAIPVIPTSFKERGRRPDALWQVRITGLGGGFFDAETPAVEAIEVLLNTDHPAARHLDDTTGSNELSDVMITTLKWEIARKLIEVVCEESNDFDANEAHPDHSIGQLLVSVLNQYNLADHARLTRLWENNRAEIDSIIQASHPMPSLSGT